MPDIRSAPATGRVATSRLGRRACLAALILAMPAFATAAPFDDPIVSADAELSGQRGTAWTDGAARMLLLTGDVQFEVGTYGFRGRSAVVRIETQHLPGRLIHRLMVQLEDGEPLRGRGPVSVAGDSFLVTARTTGSVRLAVDRLERQDAAPADPRVAPAVARFDRHLAAIAGVSSPSSRPPATRPMPPVDAGSSSDADATGTMAPITDGAPAEGRASSRFAPTTGEITILRQKDVFRPTDDGGVLMLLGQVSVLYHDTGDGDDPRDARRVAVNMTCGNAVIFLARGSEPRPGATQLDATEVRGIYLEENVVVTDGNYTVRAPRAYYDPATGRAVIIDAVFYTWDVRRRIPIYVRAEHLRQRAGDSWSGRNALITTSEFAEPHFAIGSNEVRFEMRKQPDGTTKPWASTDGIEPRVGRIGLGQWPGTKGEIGSLPLQRIDARYDSDGPTVRTRWDLFALAGRPAPPGVDLTGNVDYVGEHGPAVGANLKYGLPEMYGKLDSYLVIHDRGDDEVVDRKVEHDGDTRGYIHGLHRQKLDDHWSISLELAYVSDEMFLEEFYRTESATEKPYETSLQLKHQRDDTQFSFLAQHDLMDFVPQTTTLQAPGYTVEKLPELGYYRVGTELLGDRLTYFTENRAGRMRIRPGSDNPSNRGFSAAESLATFGMPVTPFAAPLNRVDFDTVADGAGVPDRFVHRVDSRHEINAPISVGPVNLTPYAAGRVTLYDSSFDDFVGVTGATGEASNERFWAGTGIRIHTNVTRTYDGVEVGVLDVHRLRHIVEPNVDLFTSWSSLDSRDLPYFDADVEPLTEGSGARLGIRQTFQTQRGGPGRWRSVDWIVVNTDVVLRSDDSDTDADPARHFSYRPEYSIGRDHLYTDVAWLVSDTLAFVADATHSLERDQLAQLHAGALVTHSERLTSFIEFEYLDATGKTGHTAGYAHSGAITSELVTLGFSYQMTSKYRVGLRQRWDLDRHSSRNTELIVERKLPRWTLVLVADVDDLDDNVSVGAILVPDGIKTSRRLGEYGR